MSKSLFSYFISRILQKRTGSTRNILLEKQVFQQGKNGIFNRKKPAKRPAFSLWQRLLRANVYSSGFPAVFRVCFDIESDLLSFVQSLKTIDHDSGEMNKYVLAAIVIGNKAKALVCIKPFYCTVIHIGTSKKILYSGQKKLTCLCKPFGEQMTYTNM